MNSDLNNQTEKIVHVVARYPPALGGMEQVVRCLAQAQHELGMQIRVLTSDEESTRRQREKEPFPVFRLKTYSVAHAPIMPSLPLKLMRLDRGSVIHLHISSAYVPEMVWTYARLSGCKYVAHVHLDVPPSGKFGFLLEPYKRIFLRRVLRDSSAVVVPTDDYREIISQKYGIDPHKISVIGHGTNHRVAEQTKSLAASAGDDRAKLLFVGRLAGQKNIPLLLESIATYVEKYGSDIELAIVGDGEDRRAVQSQVKRLGLSDVVSMYGPAYGEELEVIYERSDLFILTSTRESFGLVLIEAMSKGLPIVCVNIPAIRNVVDNDLNGLLVESNPVALADAIRTLLVDEGLYSKFSKNNLIKSRSSSWKMISREFGALYQLIQNKALVRRVGNGPVWGLLTVRAGRDRAGRDRLGFSGAARVGGQELGGWGHD
jgi:glycosyltransferase involved in cell wall biosynthesis